MVAGISDDAYPFFDQGSFSAMFAHEIASLQLFLVVWIFLRSLGVMC